MRNTIKKAGVCLFLATVAITSYASAKDEGDVVEAVKKRHAIFLTMGQQMKTLASMVKDDIDTFDKEAFKEATNNLYRISSKPWDLFIEDSFEDTRYSARNRASPDIYQNAMFEKSAVDYLTEVGVLTKMANDMESPKVLKAQLLRVAGSCQSCHNGYYEENKE